MPPAAAMAGQPWLLTFDFTDAVSGLLTDPAALQLDITYGSGAGFAPDYAGPFPYLGAAAFTPGQVYRIAQGQYAFIWSVPATALSGVYVASWTATYAGRNWLAAENFDVAGVSPGQPSGDVGFWGGSISYTPDPADPTVYTGAAVDLGAVDATGTAWLLNKVDGWDGADVQGAGVIPKSGDHGGWASPQFYAARNLTLTITAMAPTQALRDLARSALQSAVPVSALALFTYAEPVPRTALVRRSGRLAESYPDLYSVQFTVGLVAPDPRKYGATVKTTGQVTALPPTSLGFSLPFTLPLTTPGQLPGGAVTLTNDGDFETRPLVAINGPVTAPSLTNVNTGQTVSWSALTLGPSDQLAVDFGARTALLNGAYRPADIFSSWWVLPPGTTTVELGGQAGTGAWFSADWSDAWQ